MCINIKREDALFADEMTSYQRTGRHSSKEY